MSELCAAVDWGTTSFRLWLLDTAGNLLGERRSAEGMTSCMPDKFHNVLESHLSALSALPDLPVVICGMAGAKQGWREAPYLTVPAKIDDFLAQAVQVPDARRKILILPGLAQRVPDAADVMRGEETQIFGAFGGQTGRIVACLPGTHSKWVVIDGGRILGFSTYMTGELFAAIREHTILSKSTYVGSSQEDQDQFAAAIHQALASPQSLISLLFSIRARQLLGVGPKGSATASISGLLIGTEIASARTANGGALEDITLVASGELGARYKQAFEIANLRFRYVDAEKAVLDGLIAAARHYLANGV